MRMLKNGKTIDHKGELCAIAIILKREGVYVGRRKKEGRGEASRNYSSTTLLSQHLPKSCVIN